MKKREQKPDGYKPLAPIPRKAPGTEQRQRPLDQRVDPLEKPQEDNIYHQVHVNRISCEMARPRIGDDLAGWDVEKLRIAGLARAIQTKLCLHTCSTKYCLLNRLNPISRASNIDIFYLISPRLLGHHKIHGYWTKEHINNNKLWSRPSCRFFFPSGA